MIKNSLKIFGVLLVLLFQFTSCLNDDGKNPVYYFYEEPVVVEQMGGNSIIRNQSDFFYVPELSDNTVLKENDLLWTSFIVDMNDEENSGLTKENKIYTARHFRYKTVDSAKVIIPANAEEFQSYLSDDYSASIEFSVLYKYYIDSLLFFGFEQKDKSNQLAYTYELILNPELENSNYPTLYIRAKQLNVSPKDRAEDKQGRRVFAFDVADFVNSHNWDHLYLPSSKTIKFNLKYKTGEDSNGKDIYKSFMSNPIEWHFDK